jgi:hypothetical protein
MNGSIFFLHLGQVPIGCQDDDGTHKIDGGAQTRARSMKKELQQLNLEELSLLSAQIDNDPDKVAALLFPDRPAGHVSATQKIGQWAINQTAVIESMQNEKPEVAIIFKKVGIRIWQQLPSYAQRAQVSIEFRETHPPRPMV